MAVPCTTKHLFLTGEKGVGKSTLLQRVLAGRPVAGFRTLRVETAAGASLYLLPAGRETAATEETFLCACPPRGDEAAGARFDALGCAALAAEGPLVVMDELGRAEERAPAFAAAVLAALDGERPVLGVLQKTDSALCRAVAAHPSVTVLTVTVENRAALAETLSQWLRG